jgi:hypothetical protein
LLLLIVGLRDPSLTVSPGKMLPVVAWFTHDWAKVQSIPEYQTRCFFEFTDSVIIDPIVCHGPPPDEGGHMINTQAFSKVRNGETVSRLVINIRPMLPKTSSRFHSSRQLADIEVHFVLKRPLRKECGGAFGTTGTKCPKTLTPHEKCLNSRNLQS